VSVTSFVSSSQITVQTVGLYSLSAFSGVTHFVLLIAEADPEAVARGRADAEGLGDGSPQPGPRAEPLVGGYGGKAP